MLPEFEKFIFELTGGNPGALRVVCEVIQANEDKPGDAGKYLHALKDLELSGSEIWMLYKDECNESIERFMLAVSRKYIAKFLLAAGETQAALDKFVAA